MVGNRFESVENYLCDTFDSAFDDGIKATKVFNMAKVNCRAVYISEIKNGIDDQSKTGSYTVIFKSIRAKRSDAIKDISLLEQKFEGFFNKKVNDELVISLKKVYIVPPIEILVESRAVYLISATYNVITT